MKIEGIKTMQRLGTADLPLEDGSVVQIPIRSVGVGVERYMSHPSWYPEIPKTAKTDGKGNIVCDKDGKPEIVTDTTAPALRAENVRRAHLQRVLTVYLGIVPEEEGGKIGWDADRDELDSGKISPVDFADKVNMEMHDAGFTAPMLSTIYTAIVSLNSITDKEVKEAEGTFRG